MSGMDLVEFLNARLDENERIASAAIPGPWEIAPNGEVHSPHLSREVGLGAGRSVVELVYVTSDHEGILSSVQEGEARHIARHDPARVLREVEAKRQIIEEQTNAGACQGHPRPWMPHADYRDHGDGYCRDYDGNSTLRWLASPDADHSDYDEEWRP